MMERKQSDNHNDKKALWFLGVTVTILLLLWVLFAPGKGYLHYRKIQREIETLTQENKQLEEKNAEISKDIERLKSNDIYLEEVARQKHGLLKKNETVYEFEPPKKKKE